MPFLGLYIEIIEDLLTLSIALKRKQKWLKDLA